MSGTALVLPVLAVSMPVMGALLVRPVGGRSRPAGLTVVIITLLSTLLACLTLAADATDGPGKTLELVQLAPPVWIELRVDPMGALFAATVAALTALALTHAIGYLPDDRRQWHFHAFALACQGCLIGVAFAGNLVTLLAFYELFSLLTYVLIVHDRTPVALAAGRKYIIYILCGGALILMGVIGIFHLAGGTRFTPGGLAELSGSGAAQVSVLACLAAGFGVKAALMPLHGWVPDAHPAAPAPFSAVLSGVMVATGAFALLRVIFEIFGTDRLVQLGVMPWLGALAGTGVLLAAGRAIAEDDLKRRLAWSTISQMGYVVLGASVLDAQALAGVLLHMTHHAFLKGGLFFAAGLILAVTGIRRVSQLPGLSRRMPLTSVVLTLLALGMVGVPPLSGFISKWFLGLGLAGTGALAELGVVLAGSLLAAVYLWPVIYRIWLPPGDATLLPGPGREASPWMLGALLGAGLVSLVLGLAAVVPGFPLDLARAAAGLALGGTP